MIVIAAMAIIWQVIDLIQSALGNRRIVNSIVSPGKTRQRSTSVI
jgi:hypothetical protein